MTQNIVIILGKDQKLTEAEATKQLQAQGLQFSPDAGSIISTAFDAHGAVVAKAIEGAGHAGASIKHNVFMVPLSYALYLKDAKEKYGDIGLKNHLEASTKTALSTAVFAAGAGLGTLAASAVLAPGLVLTATGVAAGCLLAGALDMFAYNDKTLYDHTFRFV